MMTALGMDDIRCTPRVMDGITSSLDGMERLFTELVFCFFRKTIVDRPQMSRRLKQHMILYVIHPIYIYILYRGDFYPLCDLWSSPKEDWIDEDGIYTVGGASNLFLEQEPICSRGCLIPT